VNINRLIIIIVGLLLLQACTSTKFIEEGNTAMQAGDYNAALQAYQEQIIKYASSGKVSDTTVYCKAGIAALQLEQRDKALKFFEAAEDMGYSSPEMLAAMAKIYRTIDNLSLEINVLEAYYQKYQEAEYHDSITVRLFETYLESENNDGVYKLWPQIEKYAATDIDLLSGYFSVNEKDGNDSVCDKLVDQMLDIESDNVPALEWLAKKYYQQADDLYVTEMKAYQRNRTNSQYKKLLKAWDKIWPTFRKSRDYFLKLYEIEPSPKYAQYLAAIYTRMDKKKKAAYYKARSE
jgi:tetratricopeptide (TPR) repeat protein